MRLLVNFIKLVGFALMLAVVFIITGFVALTHYQGEVSGLELLNFENRPLETDPLVGWIFQIASGAGFANWTAASITGLIMLISWVACHHVFGVIRLLPDIRHYLREGQAADFWRAVVMHSSMFVLAVLILVPLLLGDAQIFQYRALAGVMNVNDPVAAANTIPALHALSADRLNLASTGFLRFQGLFMYLAMGVAPAVALELIGTSFFQTLALIVEDIGRFFERLMGPEAPAEQQIHYGFDADGQPVYDEATPLAYDVKGVPIVSAHVAHDDPVPGGNPQAERPAANQAFAYSHNEPVADPVPPEVRFDVVGGHGERVSVPHALARPDRYHVSRDPRVIYTKAFWDSLQDDAEPEDAPEREKEDA